MMKKAAQLVFVPSPGVGHLVSTIEFVKLLVNRDDRIWVTVLVMKLPFDTTTGPYTETLASYERVKVINLPECHVPTNSDGPSKHTFIDDQKPNVKEVVSNLTRSDSEPQLAAFVVDMFCTTMIDVAKEFGVPTLVFFTSGVAFLGLMLHLHTLRERDNVDISELEDSDTELAIPSFVNPVPSKALPSFVLQKEWETVFLRYGRGLKEASGIIVNSFEELESYAVHSFSDSGVPIYPVGPILNPEAKGDQVSESHYEILKWLDDQPHASVIFLCFGSMGSFDDDQIREIARALESSGARFLWSLRKPPPKGSTSRMVLPSDYSPSDLAAVLPEGFLDRTAGIGRVIGWAPQAQVLAHPATGGFVSHCGWNSTLESIYFGVPIATWPLYAEQQTNAFELVRELKMAVEIAVDYQVDFRTGSNYVLSGEKIERGIRSVLEKDGEIRKKVKEMSEKSKKTLSEGGCSSSHLERLIDYITSQV
ncbi:UDP-glucose flavonoid 3-O-glucosyltransferase 6-like [Gastrolobium bilobum]|uniref:UDP-glucose flavonoid 3-O-glucosyltransferase 6-like n=1 Tax=Gastrolobium bilobum TaxID=150636 RepID=UPI002AB1D361|nr:UDP-glucose flavonoid 3-O-glucosyltransferase 6-like [Gastrolobium bilobum]